MKLSLQLVTWNGAEWLPGLFESLRRIKNQESRIKELLVLDNGSTDGTVELLKKELPTLPFPHQLVELQENIGFAAGHNRLFRISNAEYILIFNQDMVFELDCIEKLAQFLDAHPEAAAVAPRLMRLKELRIKNQELGFVDSLGLKKYRTWKVVDIGAGNVWKPTDESQQPKAVFGVSGACAMFRVSALQRITFPDATIFDESYGSYKEDVDLAFRLASSQRFMLHVSCFMLPDAVAYHARGSGDGKKDQPFALRYQSYRNHLATIFKNFSARYILDLPFVLCYEAGKIAWYLLFDRKVLGAWRELWQQRKNLLQKRIYITQNAKLKSQNHISKLSN